MIEPGKTVGGRYKIKSHVGTGGMATVYLAQDLILERPGTESITFRLPYK